MMEDSSEIQKNDSKKILNKPLVFPRKKTTLFLFCFVFVSAVGGGGFFFVGREQLKWWTLQHCGLWYLSFCLVIVYSWNRSLLKNNNNKTFKNKQIYFFKVQITLWGNVHMMTTFFFTILSVTNISSVKQHKLLQLLPGRTL